MSIFNQNDENEKEMSGGLMFGYALIGFVVVIIIAFVIFVAVKLVGNKLDKSNDTEKQAVIETTIDTNDIDS